MAAWLPDVISGWRRGVAGSGRVQAVPTRCLWFAGLRKEYAFLASSLAMRFSDSLLAFVTPVSVAAISSSFVLGAPVIEGEQPVPDGPLAGRRAGNPGFWVTHFHRRLHQATMISSKTRRRSCGRVSTYSCTRPQTAPQSGHDAAPG